MSDRVSDNGIHRVWRAQQESIHRASPVYWNRGVGMLEFLVALLIFSTAMMGLMSTQLAGKRANFEASEKGG